MYTLKERKEDLKATIAFVQELKNSRDVAMIVDLELVKGYSTTIADLEDRVIPHMRRLLEKR
jgi:hypothetical protein